MGCAFTVSIKLSVTSGHGDIPWAVNVKVIFPEKFWGDVYDVVREFWLKKYPETPPSDQLTPLLFVADPVRFVDWFSQIVISLPDDTVISGGSVITIGPTLTSQLFASVIKQE